MPVTTVDACAICAGDITGQVTARECMFGTGHEFSYGTCGRCGCVQLLDVPDDLSPYYDDGYYSLAAADPTTDRFVRRLYKRSRTSVVLRSPSVGRRLFPDRPAWIDWFVGRGVTRRSTIADVGCGGGATLNRLAREGFRSLSGVDPYVDREIRGRGYVVRPGTVEDVPAGTDVIMFHHSLEHIVDQHATLRAAAERVSRDGFILVRVPMCDSAAWAEYGTDWVQLDPPRHLFLHTSRSLSLLAERCGLRVDGHWRDSWSFQFWGSEQNRRGIPLIAPNSAWVDVAGSPFTTEDLARFDAMAQAHNAAGVGDQGVFVLRPT